jgi:hypothetical protein
VRHRMTSVICYQ